MAAKARIAAAPHSAQVAKATVAEQVADALANAGVEVAFTFPGGGSNLALLDALQVRGVATVLTRSEVGGGLMASTAADINGNPGALIVGLGPGTASAVNAVAHARLDRSPLLLIADRYSDADLRTTGHQVLDQRALYAPLVKAYVDAQPEDLGRELSRAIALALRPPRGPVLIEMARDHARSRVSAHAEGQVGIDAVPASPVESDVVEAAEQARGARKPVVLVGDEARRDVDPAGLVALAERLRAPVMSTYKGKGVFPDSHPLAAGIVTGAEIERPLLSEADLLLTVGLDPVELLARPWTYDAPVVALRLGSEADSYLRPRVTLAGPLAASLSALRATLGQTASEWTPGDARERADAMLAQLRSDGGALPAWRVVEIAHELAGDARVTVDAGAHMFPVTWLWGSDRPNRFHISNGLATMGYALPAAIGAALAAPRELVLAFTGDGGFTINAAELETAARVGAKVIVLVLNDSSLSLIRVKQEENRLERSNVDFVRSDFARLAESLGVKGASASNEAELRTALRAALAAQATTVIDVQIDGSEYAETHRRVRSGS
jgi:acetolactate synthase I/II/III large subunit